MSGGDEVELEKTIYCAIEYKVIRLGFLLAKY